MTIHAMIQHDDTKNAFLPELVFWGYRLLACLGVQAPSLYYGRDARTPNGQDARAPQTGETPVLPQTGEAPVLPQTGEMPVLHQNLEM